VAHGKRSAGAQILRLLASALTVPAVFLAPTRPAAAQAERYEPTIWVDPDGCEHWVMDDGTEGYMSPHLRRDGSPVCRRGQACGVMPADQFFASGSARIGPEGRARLARFFREQGAAAYIITGHTDAIASDAANLRLSHARAAAVAAIAREAGARVSAVQGRGERQPRASNATPEGRAANRRVEITCIR